MRTSASKSLLEDLARAITAPEEPTASARLAERLATLSGPGWLNLDDSARSPFWDESMSPLDRITLPPPGSGVLAAVAGSMSRDGHVREEAVKILARSDEPIAGAALAIRAADWAAPVRDPARIALHSRFIPEYAAVVVPVLLAARERHRGRPPADEYLARLAREPITTIQALASAGQRAGRTWALRVLADRGQLTSDLLTKMAMRDPDPVIALWCARAMSGAQRAPASACRQFLSSARAGVRAFAVGHLADEQLPEPELRPLLLDRSGAVRSAARWRWKKRFGETAAVYRAVLVDAQDQSMHNRQLAAALQGLADDNVDDLIVLAVPFLTHPSPAVRLGATRAIGGRGTPDDIVRHLIPLLRDPSRKVATAAARYVRGWDVPAAVVTDLEAGNVVSRRIGLSLRQYEGGWARVRADLAGMKDEDPAIANSARHDLLSWLHRGAASNYSTTPPEAADDIARLLAESELTSFQRRAIAFALGIPGSP